MKGSPIYCRVAVLLGALVFVAGGCATHNSTSPLDPAHSVQITPVDDKLRIEINGQLFSEYHYKDVARQFLYPVLGPDQLAMSRKWPVEESTDEQHDHPHHRGLWYAHSSVDGFDFWSEGKGCKIDHQKF